MPLIVRNDDVLIPSRAWSDPVSKFRQCHEWIKDAPGILHMPTIIVGSIKQFPETIEYIKEETANGKMSPQIHCLVHEDYAKFPKEKVIDHLKECMEFMWNVLGVIPTIWATPWGSGPFPGQEYLHEAAQECGLTLMDTRGRLELPGDNGVLARLRNGEPLSAFDGKVVLFHWWAHGARLARLSAVAKCGSWEAAKQANKELFRG